MIEILKLKDVLESLKQFQEILNIAYFKNKLEEKLKIFNRKKFKEIQLENPFFEYQSYLNSAKQKKLEKEKEVLENLEEDLNKLKQFAQEYSIDISQFLNEIANLKASNYDIYLIREKIVKELDRLVKYFYSNWLESKKDALLNEFVESVIPLLEKVKVVYKFFYEISLPNSLIFNPYLCDNIETEIDKFIEFINSNPLIPKLKNFIRRIKQIESVPEEIEIKNRIDSYLPPISSDKELEIIKLDNNIQTMISSELVNLSNEELSRLFDMKFLEKRLMCFDLNNLSHIFEEEILSLENKEKIINITIAIEAKNNNLDYIKFISIYIINKYLQLNSHIKIKYIDKEFNINTINVSKGFSLKGFKEFLELFFYKDTQFPFITIKDSNLTNNRIYFLSDFIVEVLNDEIIEYILTHKKTPIYSILVKEKIVSKIDYKIFDKELILKPNENLYKLKRFIVETL